MWTSFPTLQMAKEGDRAIMFVTMNSLCCGRIDAGLSWSIGKQLFWIALITCLVLIDLRKRLAINPISG